MEVNSVEFFKSTPYQLPKTIKTPILIGWRIINPQNCGSLLRIADTIGCQKVIFVKGKNQNFSDRMIRKTAGASFERMPFEFLSEEDWIEKIPNTFQKVAIETASNSKNIYQTSLPNNIALMVGNEKKGIPPEIVEQCDQVVHIPLTGNCTSLNVTQAASVAIFEWLRQINKKIWENDH